MPKTLSIFFASLLTALMAIPVSNLFSAPKVSPKSDETPTETNEKVYRFSVTDVDLSSPETPIAFLFSKTRKHPRYEQLQSGDIVFQDTGGQQGEAVRAATGSDFTHCGVVFNSNGTLYVLEAVQPVSIVSLKDWKKRSTVFHARRLKNPEKLDQAAFTKALAWGEKQLGKPYDFHFRWGDNSLYCSELVWKIYKQGTGISLCQPKSFESYFLEDDTVREVIRQRYGDLKKLPKKEPVVAPSDLAASPLLIEVPKR